MNVYNRVRSDLSQVDYILKIKVIFSVRRERLTVPATDFDERKVFALNLDNPKSHT